MHSPRERRGRPRLWLKMVIQILSNVEPEWMKKKIGLHMETNERQDHQDLQLYVVKQPLDHVSLLKQMMKDLVEEAER